jgi:hypothetical protein
VNVVLLCLFVIHTQQDALTHNKKYNLNYVLNTVVLVYLELAEYRSSIAYSRISRPEPLLFLSSSSSIVTTTTTTTTTNNNNNNNNTYY